MKKSIAIIVTCFNLGLFILFVLLSKGYLKNNSMTATDLLTILLTVLGISINVLSIFIAGFAFLGYTNLSKIATDRVDANMAEVQRNLALRIDEKFPASKDENELAATIDSEKE